MVSHTLQLCATIEPTIYYCNNSFPGRGLTDESEILKFLQHGTLVGLLPVPHPILIRKYQANSGTTMWFRTYLWGVIYLRLVSRYWCFCPTPICLIFSTPILILINIEKSTYILLQVRGRRSILIQIQEYEFFNLW